MSLCKRWSGDPESADAGKIKVRPSARPLQPIVPPKSPNTSLFMVLIRALRIPGKSSLAIKCPVFRTDRFPQPTQPRHLSAATSRMAQPKYLTGDKAGIDAFVDQFDVSL